METALAHPARTGRVRRPASRCAEPAAGAMTGRAGTLATVPDEGEPTRRPAALVHCFRCEDVVTVSQQGDDRPLWCSACDDLLGPPPGATSVRWGPADEHPTSVEVEDDARPRPRRASRGASLLGAGMLGLHQALYGPVDDEAPVVVVSDEPETDGPMEVHLEDRPRASWIRFHRDERSRPPGGPS